MKGKPSAYASAAQLGGSSTATPLTQQSQKVLLEISKTASKQQKQSRIDNNSLISCNKGKNSNSISENIEDDEVIDNCKIPLPEQMINDFSYR